MVELVGFVHSLGGSAVAPCTFRGVASVVADRSNFQSAAKQTFDASRQPPHAWVSTLRVRLTVLRTRAPLFTRPYRTWNSQPTTRQHLTASHAMYLTSPGQDGGLMGNSRILPPIYADIQPSPCGSTTYAAYERDHISNSPPPPQPMGPTLLRLTLILPSALPFALICNATQE